jgi:SET domain-containing protein
MSGGRARPAGPIKLPANIRRQRSGLHGWGIFARDFIPQDSRIIEYVGERITKAEAQRREDRRLARRAAGGDGCVYIFEVSLRHDIDGNVPWNPARHINHSCAPNSEAQMDRGRIWIVARRDIAPGEELTYDYGFSFSESRHHPCRCGAKECAGFIVEQAQRWRLRRKSAGPA